MANLLVFGLFILGLFLIIKGGDWFVDSSSWIARATGVPSFIVGATIVSVATTLPELIVSLQASLSGKPDIAIGNAVGSTICNIGLIAALSLMTMQIKVDNKTYLTKAMIMLLSTLTFALLAIDKVLSKPEALILIAFLLFFIYYNIKSVKASKEDVSNTIDKQGKTIVKNVLYFVFGAIFIIAGARLLVDNGIIIAEIFGVPENIIALTFIALGTSLPELTTTISSIIKKDTAIGIGNILGANILNITLILSFSSLLSPSGLMIPTRDFDLYGLSMSQAAQTLILDVPLSLLLMALMIIPVAVKGKLYKLQGQFMILVYFFYLLTLVTLS